MTQITEQLIERIARRVFNSMFAPALRQSNVQGGGTPSSVRYAEEAGHADSADSANAVPWTGVSGKPSNLFAYLGQVSNDYVEGTTYSTLNSGTYMHQLTGATDSLIHFQADGSASGLDIRFSYTQDASNPLKYRKTTDNHHFSGGWVTIIDSNNIGSQSVNYATTAGTATYANSAGSASSAGYATSAGSATNDGDGNAISSTYLKLSGDTMTGHLTLSNGKYIKVKDTSNRELALFGITESNYVIFGMGTAQYHESIIDGHQIRFRYWTTGSTPERKDGMILTNAGKVGIGTLNPIEKLHVDGKLYVSGGFTFLSDIRKKNVLDYDQKLSVNEIAKAPLIHYTLKDDPEKEVHVGSIAQYWQKYLPETVHKHIDGTLAMQVDVQAHTAAIVLARKVCEIEKRISKIEKGLQ